MKLHFFGADRTTTGSRHLLEVNGKRILLECGMYQGKRAESVARNREMPFDSSQIDVLLLSHAHIDHSGTIPVLCRSGFRGDILCTEATKDLCNVMLLDSAHIQEQDAAFVSKKHAKKGLPPVEPLYTQAETEIALQQFRGVPYHEPVAVIDGVTAQWLDAGHILGSAMIILDIEEAGRKVRLAFTGDLGRGHNDLLRDPEHPQDVDYLLSECTYGNRDHEPAGDVNQRVCDIINRAVQSRGKIIIPAFAVGRCQQLLYTLYELARTGCIPRLPTYVDSPLSLQATEVFRRHPEGFNKKFYDIMMNAQNPFALTNLNYVETVQESKSLNDVDGSCIIISASGMAEAGRIRHHIKNNIEDDRNTILIVGWCAPNTLGAQLAAGQKEVSVFGEQYRVRARIETIDAYSGHADRTELRDWIGQISGPLTGIIFVHGEEDAALSFAETIRAQRPAGSQTTVTVPNFGDVLEL